MRLNENVDDFINSLTFDKKTSLCDLLIKYESDKCSSTSIYNGWHNYSSLYYFLFEHLMNEKVNIFEMGIYKASSVRAFRDFFKSGKIFAGDVDTQTFIYNENINCYYCDQDNSILIKNLFDSFNFEFDIIIDDGKHEFLSNLNMLQNSIHKLKKGGLYIVEDLRFDVLDEFNKIIDKIKIDFDLSYIKIHIIEHKINKIDNNLLIIQK